MKLCLLVQVAFSGNLFWFMTFFDEPGYWWQWCGVEQVQGQGPPHRKCGLCMVSFAINCEFEILRLLRILDLDILMQNWNVFLLVLVHCWGLISLWNMSANLQLDTVIVLGFRFGCNTVKGFNNANMCFASSDVCSGLTTNNYTELAEIYSKYKNQGELYGTYCFWHMPECDSGKVWNLGSQNVVMNRLLTSDHAILHARIFHIFQELLFLVRFGDFRAQISDVLKDPFPSW